MAHKPIPTDAEYYVKRTKEKASQLGQTAQNIQKIRGDMTDDTLAEVELLRARKLLDDVKRGLSQPNNSLLAQIFAGKTPDEINEYLETLSPNALANLMSLTRATADGGGVAVAAPAAQKSEVDMLLTAVRLMKELQPPQPAQQGNSAKEIVDAVVAGMKLAQPAGNGEKGNLLETIKTVAEIQKPFIENQGKTNKELMDLKLKEIESKMPADPIEQIKYVKEVAGTLGLGNAKTDIDLRLEEMRQDREVDKMRLDWEQKKYEMDADADNQKWEQISKILEGPIGKAIQGIGNAGADRVRGGKSTGKAPTPVQTQCPQCSSVIFVDQAADTAICGHCGAVLQKQGAPMPPQPQPEQPAPAAQPAQEPVRVEPQEAPEGEEDNEPAENEGGEEGGDKEPE